MNIITPRTFTDGRVGAIILLDDPRAPSPIEPEFMVFVEQDDRWLIDDLPAYAPPNPDQAMIPAAEASANRAAWALVDADPAGCQIAPRDAAELAAMEGTWPAGPSPDRPQRTPLPVWPEGVPADADSIAGIKATVAELAACAAADEPLRSASLIADDLIASPYFSINTGPPSRVLKKGVSAQLGLASRSLPSPGHCPRSFSTPEDGGQGAVRGAVRVKEWARPWR